MKSFGAGLSILIMLLLILFHSCKKDERIRIPVLETLSITNITDSSASCGGNITDDGGASITERGVCWSTSTIPTITDNKTSDSKGNGSFTSTITGLSVGTTYYVKAYATNSSGTGYGMAMSFKTLNQVPATTTQAPTNVLSNSATLNGIVNPKNLSTVVTFEYGMDTSYGQISTAKQSPLSGSINKSVSANITELSAGTTYHFRVKAENALGITFGGDMSFITLGQIPASTTQAATNILPYSATLNGTVNANYLSTTVTFEYGQSTGYGNIVSAAQSPVTGGSSVNVSAGITGLSYTTSYHFRLKAENALGITYGNDMSFETVGNIPASTTQAATIITPNSATVNGTVNANYFSTLVTFEYGPSTSYGDTIIASQSPVTGGSSVNLSARITGLPQATTYHYRVKAVNTLGITYGSDMTFTTLTPLTDIDGNIYNTVKIGTQEWMAENLKTTKFNDNTSIQLVATAATWSGLSSPAYCWYNDNEAGYKATYGAMYNWYTVNTGKLCPPGWHVSTDAEWTILTNYLGVDPGSKLKEQGTSHWQSPNTGATNESYFTALPGGYRNNSGQFATLWSYGYWWCTNENNSTTAWFRSLYYMNGNVTRSNISKIYGYSVRCIKGN